MTEHIMQEISEDDFERFDIASNPPLGLTTERAWFQCGPLLGIVLIDNVDRDWSFVALSRTLPETQYRAFDVGTSYASQEEATEALAKALESP
jgi:hypothetical protein